MVSCAQDFHSPATLSRLAPYDDQIKSPIGIICHTNRTNTVYGTEIPFDNARDRP